MILGSGPCPSGGGRCERDVIPYAEIPHFPVSTVAATRGGWSSARWRAAVCVMQGRFHSYEGHSLQTTFPCG
ncbi:MAG: hypothetical protein R3A10_02750 [Caldilineaceae bacterium]